MTLGIKMGERGTLKDIVKTYSAIYLINHGLLLSQNGDLTGIGSLAALAETKHGKMIARSDNVLTYLGGCLWDVRQE